MAPEDAGADGVERAQPRHALDGGADELADALDRPTRPLFIGRKSCLPSCRVFAGWQEADNMLHALQSAQLPEQTLRFRVQWPDGEGTLAGDRQIDLCDERNWVSGVHGGWRPVREGSFTASGVRQ